MKAKREGTCPLCHQPLREVREGVPLSPLKARIFDLVRRAGGNGISLVDINDIAFGGRSTLANVKTHIHQINDLLVETDLVIRGDGALRGFYRLHRSAQQ